MQIVILGNSMTLVSEENFNTTFAESLQAKMVEALEQSPAKNLVLDMRTVEIIDSTGIKLLVGLYKTCQSQDRNLCVQVAHANVSKVIRLCKLEQLIEIQEVVHE